MLDINYKARTRLANTSLGDEFLCMSLGHKDKFRDITQINNKVKLFVN